MLKKVLEMRETPTSLWHITVDLAVHSEISKEHLFDIGEKLSKYNASISVSQDFKRASVLTSVEGDTSYTAMHEVTAAVLDSFWSVGLGVTIFEIYKQSDKDFRKEMANE